MNLKDIFVVTGLALITTWGIDYFVMSRFRTTNQTHIMSGQTFNAPLNKQVVKPLNVEIDFIDQKRVAPEQITEITTSWGYLVFSSEGAALERLEFNHALDPSERIITIFPAIEREKKAFLVALDEKTPYYFKLVDHTENEAYATLTYEGSFGDGLLIKRFTINKQVHKIDLSLEVTAQARSDNALQLRVFYPAPLMPDIKGDTISALVSNTKGALEKTTQSSINLQEGWWSPMIFGAENKFFIHALIADQNHFVERAYYTVTPEKRLISIIESFVLDEQKTDRNWTLSFYCGPKDVHAIVAVDERLEQALDYSGILAPLSKALLRLLDYLYGYVHNYGLAIILLTILMKLLLLPFTIRGDRNLRKPNDLQKKMHYVQQQYKNDPERMRLEQAELLRKHGMPQIAGCIPLLLQLPIFIALSRVLSNSIELYKAPFYGWIHDLSAPDPYYILPLLIAISMILQALHGDANHRTSMLVGGLLFGAFSANMASGLVIYICSSTLLNIVQMMLSKRAVV